MKKIAILCALMFSFAATSVVSAQQVNNSCKWGPELKKRFNKDLKPFRYYAFKITNITLSDKSQFKEVEVPLFHNANYRFVFNAEGLDQNVKIQIYDKPAKAKDRRKLYEANSSQKHFVYDPPKSDTHHRIYIDYVIPASSSAGSGTVNKGCIIFYSGFKNN